MTLLAHESTRARSNRILLVLAGALLLSAPAAGWSRTTQLDYSWSWENAAYSEVALNKAAGKMYSRAIESDGAGFVIVSLGGALNLNPDSMLPASYSSKISLALHAKGQLTCGPYRPQYGGGPSQVVAYLTLDLDRWTGSAWESLDSWTTQMGACVGNSVFATYDSIDETFNVVSPSVTFEAGKQYKISAEVFSHVMGDVSGATADFYASSQGYVLDINGLSVANQPPVAQVTAPKRAYLTNLVSGTPLSSRACDLDGVIGYTRLVVEATSLDEKETYRNPSTPCAGLNLNPRILRPGIFEVTATARDDGFVTDKSVAYADVQLITTETARLGLAALPPESLGNVVEVEHFLDEAGEIVAIRVNVDGEMRVPGEAPAMTSHVGRLVYDRPAGVVAVSLDDVPRWAGAVRQTGASWWEVSPAAGSEPQGVSPSPVTIGV